ncbi:MAG: polysaccharide biosynthesis protein [Ruminococcaceae bacterium]|nr:polysaccharide biosynthesis protein [Oscillospiraceae bacterium]
MAVKTKKVWQNKPRIRSIVKKASVDLLFILIASVLSVLLVADTLKLESLDMLWWTLMHIACAALAFSLSRTYLVSYRSFALIDTLMLFFAFFLIAAVEILYAFLTPVRLLHAVLYLVLFFAAATAVRLAFRLRQELLMRYTHKDDSERIVVVGAGVAGNTVIRELQGTDKMKYRPVAIVDDDLAKQGMTVGGVLVVGTTYEIKAVVEKYRATGILFAIPSATAKQKKEILSRCQIPGIRLRTVPGLYQLVTGEVSLTKMRDVEVGDLLGREQIKVDLNEIKDYISDEVVLVTGGGGSIGSELCRQIAEGRPRQLIIFDVYENNAYDIEQELRTKHASLNLLVLIGSIRDKGKLEDVFEKYHPTVVFNAAAHKHVPLMETSPCEAVKNNVFGTLNVARAADKYGAKRFVQISTDKAVNPTNIMGATKRICEMIIQTVGKHSETDFVAVRFGNVLGSNGSVIPLFKKQIAEGGPVTVTHPDIIRYFMTIPEAVSLVLQAGAYATGGEIYVLDMGEQVRIYDLAENLIRLSGFEPGVDIDIVCTGLRPGEKLYEERLMDEEGMQKTANASISIGKPIELDEDAFFHKLDALYEAAYAESPDMKNLVHELVPTYTIDKRNS